VSRTRSPPSLPDSSVLTAHIGQDANVRTPWIVGISGASGTAYARSVLRGLAAAGEPVDLIVSRAARLTLLDETGLAWRDDPAQLAGWLGLEPGEPDIRTWPAGDLAAGPSSGSYPARGMLVVPASTEAVASIALGLSKDLLQRSAAVTLKERRPLVVVPREMPLARSTLVHLLALNDAGAVVAPASPGFYAGATDAQALADFVAAKILDVIGVPHQLMLRWTGTLGAGRNAAESKP
jgi:4-hydroxy-3-polyprenylbenzoate decarboxylase